MATVDKNFRIKNGLAVEGTTATVNGENILTQGAGDSYIINLNGGTATSDNVASTVVKRDANGNFVAGTITANLVGNVTGTVSSLSNHDTSDLAEGTNLYFTNARAISATAASYDILGAASAAQSAAITAAATDATSKANAAQSAAEFFATSADSTLYGTISADIITAIANEETARNSAIDSAIMTEASARNNAISTAKSEAILDAHGYTDTAVANLVDSAPAMLDTLGELATALQENPDIISDLQDIAASKASSADFTDHVNDTSAHGVNGNVVGTTDSQDLSNKRFIDTTYFTDGVTIANEGQIGVISGSHEFEIQASYGALGLKSVSGDIVLTPGTGGKSVKWGSNILATETYATDAANAAQAAAEATAAAANTAQQAGTTAFTALNINDEAKQIAASSTSLGSVVVTAYEWPKAAYRSGKFVVKIDNGTHNEISEILVTLDSADNVAITEYAIVGTNGSRGSITAQVAGSNVQIRVNPVNDSTIKVSGTLLK